MNNTRITLKFDDVSRETSRASKRALEYVAEQYKGRLATYSPRDSGNLINHADIVRRTNKAVTIGYVNIKYAKRLQSGTVRIKTTKNPKARSDWMDYTYSSGKAQFKNAFKNALERYMG